MMPPSWVPFVGGMIHGLCCGIKELLTGRGLVVGTAEKDLLISGFQHCQLWRLCFTGGMFLGGVWLRHYLPTVFYAMPPDFPLWRLVLGGVLTGCGCVFGSGYTAEHGITGIPHFAVRSMAHVATYMPIAFVVATLFRSSRAVANSTPSASWKDLPEDSEAGTHSPLKVDESGESLKSPHLLPVDREPKVFTMMLFGVLCIPTMVAVALHFDSPHTPILRSEPARLWAEIFFGGMFALGLGVAGVLSPLKITRFLDLSKLREWDPFLCLVCIGTYVTAVPLTQLVILPRAAKGAPPLFGGSFSLPDFTPIDRKLLLGAVMFGAGWGLTGIDPASGLICMAQRSPKPFVIFCGAMGAAMVGTSVALSTNLIHV